MIEKSDTDEWIDLLVAKYQRQQDSVRGLEATVDRLIDRVADLERWTIKAIEDLERGYGY